MRLGICLLTVLGLAVLAHAKDLVVDPAGGGDFTTVQEAVDSVPSRNSTRVRIHLKRGVYKERLNVRKEKTMVSLIGGGTRPEETVITFDLKASDPKPDGSGNVGTTGSASVYINANDFIAENITFENSAGDNVGQAVAIKTTGDRLIFNNCRFLGFQDTLYPTSGRSYFKDCYITGDTDFIFGNGTVVFDHCTINSSDGGYITAANTSPESEYGFVFLDCALTAPKEVKANSVYLGRPWQWDRGSKACVAFLRTKMGPHIRATGWHPWDTARNATPGETSRYREFASTDMNRKPIDTSKRANWTKQLDPEQAENYTVKIVLGGTDEWDAAAALKE